MSNRIFNRYSIVLRCISWPINKLGYLVLHSKVNINVSEHYKIFTFLSIDPQILTSRSIQVHPEDVYYMSRYSNRSVINCGLPEWRLIGAWSPVVESYSSTVHQIKSFIFNIWRKPTKFYFEVQRRELLCHNFHFPSTWVIFRTSFNRSGLKSSNCVS